jgi:hypothetical protein
MVPLHKPFFFSAKYPTFVKFRKKFVTKFNDLGVGWKLPNFELFLNFHHISIQGSRRQPKIYKHI